MVNVLGSRQTGRKRIAPPPLELDPTDPQYLIKAFHALNTRALDIAKMVGDMSRPVDEYIENPTVSENVATLEVLPQFEQISERITSIVITASPGAVGTLQLGDRLWDITIPASGVLHIGPIS